ncbi:flagellar hook-associated protein 3 [Methylophaga sp. 41_12_T18]|mgnify:CR=1 FL=1|nr:flagellar hook-associated protein 3 [Methylophaga sp. 41_12_T18]
MRVSTAYMFDQNLSAMLKQQTELGQTQQQISTGKRILKPSDDPVASVAILNLQREFNLTEQYLTNADKAENNLVVEEGALKSSTDILQRIRELAVQGLNSTNTIDDRSAIALEMSQLNEQLLSLANTKNSSGNYLFSGFSSDTPPYTSIGSSYGGDSGQRNLQVGAGVLIETNDAGNQIFEAEHTQTSVTDNGGPSSSSLTIVEIGQTSTFTAPVTVSFASATNTLTITDGTNTETVVPYSAGEPVDINQLNSNFPSFTVQLDGTLADGDSYTLDTQVLPSQTVFKTINDFANALRTNSVSANDSPNNGDFLTNISSVMDTVVDAQAKIGARINVIELQRDINSDLSINMENILSQTQDLDYAEAISRLELQSLGLQAAQQSFVKVQGLTLFNFL